MQTIQKDPQHIMHTDNLQGHLDNIKCRLINKEITIYKAVEIILGASDKYLPQLQDDVLNGSKPYYRLFAAWCIGKLKDNKNESILKKAYFKEKDNNVRANIVWAYLRVQKTNKQMFKHFLDDEYFLIRLLSLKRIGTNHIFKPDVSVKKFLKDDEHPLVRIEAIRKSNFFVDKPETVYKEVKSILFKSLNILEIEACLRAMGNSCNIHTLDVLVDFYKKRLNLINKFENIAVAYCRAISDNNESAAYQILVRIYFKRNTSEFVKYCAIEALAVGGGPQSYEALLNIYRKEHSLNIKNFIKVLINKTEITDL